MDDIKKKQEEYWKKNELVGRYNISYLDKKLGGISKSDLVIIGAKSGAGKTTLSHILFNANDKRTTALFSLENFDGDVLSGIIRRFYNEESGSKISQRDWQIKNIPNFNQDAYDAACKKAAEDYEGRMIFGRKSKGLDPKTGGEIVKDWTVKEIAEKMVHVATRGVKLIILDHLDYIQKEQANDSDNQHIVDLMKTIRNVQETFEVAVVAFSHLRKTQGKQYETLIPSEDEFIGSGDKIKQATQVIVLAPYNDISPAVRNDLVPGENQRASLIQIRKNRNGAVRLDKAAVVLFNLDTEDYDSLYREESIKTLAKQDSKNINP